MYVVARWRSSASRDSIRRAQQKLPSLNEHHHHMCIAQLYTYLIMYMILLSIEIKSNSNENQTLPIQSFLSPERWAANQRGVGVEVVGEWRQYEY